MDKSNCGNDMEGQIESEIRNHDAINIAKVNDDAFKDKSDGDEVKGTYAGTLYKDDNGGAFVHITELDGVDTEELHADEGPMPSHLDPTDVQHGGDALDIFMITRKNKPNAKS